MTQSGHDKASTRPEQRLGRPFRNQWPAREELSVFAQEPKRRRVAGFGTWFLANTPAEEVFGLYVERASLDYNRMLVESRADAEPVPEHAPLYRKSRAVIALQLIKRWRNIAY